MSSDDIDQRFGRNVYWHRIEQGLTYRDLSEASGVAFSHISFIEKGNRGVSLHHAMALAKALGVPLSVLVEEDASTYRREIEQALWARLKAVIGPGAQEDTNAEAA